MTVCEDLHLDVARSDDGLFDEHRPVAEGSRRLAGRRIDGVAEFCGVVDAAHPASSAARHCLDEQGKRDASGLADEGVDVGGGIRGLKDGDTSRPCRRDGSRLISREPEHFGRGPDECQPRLRARRSELGILGKESVTRVHGGGLGLVGCRDDVLDRKVCPERRIFRPDFHGLVGGEPVEGVAILDREDRDAAHSQFLCGATGADRNFASVRD